jgi:rhamnosyltransferase
VSNIVIHFESEILNYCEATKPVLKVTPLPTFKPVFGVIVPTYNPGLKAWVQWVQAMRSQNCQPIQVVVVDSGSTDGTQAFSQQAGFTVLKTHAQDFNHGATRQWALNQAFLNSVSVPSPETSLGNSPKFIVFLTQDAVLANPDALTELLQAFQDPQVAAAYGRQLPKPDAHWLEAHTRAFNYPKLSRTVQLPDKASLGIKACFLSNSFAAYRLQALIDQGGFPAHLPIGEDTFIAAKFLLSGQSLRYQAGAAVYHSHNYNGLQDFQRMFDTGVFHAQNPWLLESFGKAEEEGVKLVLSQWQSLQTQQSFLRGLLQLLYTNVLKYVGYKLGRAYRYLPRTIVKKFAMHKVFWQQKS